MLVYRPVPRALRNPPMASLVRAETGREVRPPPSGHTLSGVTTHYITEKTPSSVTSVSDLEGGGFSVVCETPPEGGAVSSHEAKFTLPKGEAFSSDHLSVNIYSMERDGNRVLMHYRFKDEDWRDEELALIFFLHNATHPVTTLVKREIKTRPVSSIFVRSRRDVFAVTYRDAVVYSVDAPEGVRSLVLPEISKTYTKSAFEEGERVVFDFDGIELFVSISEGGKEGAVVVLPWAVRSDKQDEHEFIRVHEKWNPPTINGNEKKIRPLELALADTKVKIDTLLNTFDNHIEQFIKGFRPPALVDATKERGWILRLLGYKDAIEIDYGKNPLLLRYVDDFVLKVNSHTAQDSKREVAVLFNSKDDNEDVSNTSPSGAGVKIEGVDVGLFKNELLVEKSDNDRTQVYSSTSEKDVASIACIFTSSRHHLCRYMKTDNRAILWVRLEGKPMGETIRLEPEYKSTLCSQMAITMYHMMESVKLLHSQGIGVIVLGEDILLDTKENGEMTGSISFSLDRVFKVEQTDHKSLEISYWMIMDRFYHIARKETNAGNLGFNTVDHLREYIKLLEMKGDRSKAMVKFLKQLKKNPTQLQPCFPNSKEEKNSWKGKSDFFIVDGSLESFASLIKYAQTNPGLAPGCIGLVREALDHQGDPSFLMIPFSLT